MIVFNCVRKFCKNESGNVFVAVALAPPLLMGAIGLGAAYWSVLHRGMQDAADSAGLNAVITTAIQSMSLATGVTLAVVPLSATACFP